MTTNPEEDILTAEDVEAFRDMATSMPNFTTVLEAANWALENKDRIIPFMLRTRQIIVRTAAVEYPSVPQMTMLRSLTLMVVRMAEILDIAGIPLPEDQ
jgi:hypothetical protein